MNQLYALRFLVGMLEAPVFAGTHFILGMLVSVFLLSGLLILIDYQDLGILAPNSSNVPVCGSYAIHWAVW